LFHYRLKYIERGKRKARKVKKKKKKEKEEKEEEIEGRSRKGSPRENLSGFDIDLTAFNFHTRLFDCGLGSLVRTLRQMMKNLCPGSSIGSLSPERHAMPSCTVVAEVPY
jgi:hypothetical protein